MDRVSRASAAATPASIAPVPGDHRGGGRSARIIARARSTLKSGSEKSTQRLVSVGGATAAAAPIAAGRQPGAPGANNSPPGADQAIKAAPHAPSTKVSHLGAD